MNLQSLIVVALRLMALNLVLKLFISSSTYIFDFIKNAIGKNGGYFPTVFLIIIFVFLSSALFLWMFSIPIARLLTRKIPTDLNIPAVNRLDCYTVAFICIGLYFTIDNLCSVFFLIYVLFDPSSPWKNKTDFKNILQVFTPFICGLVLFLNSRNWAIAFARWQEKDEERKIKQQHPL